MQIRWTSMSSLGELQVRDSLYEVVGRIMNKEFTDLRVA